MVLVTYVEVASSIRDQIMGDFTRFLFLLSGSFHILCGNEEYALLPFAGVQPLQYISTVLEHGSLSIPDFYTYKIHLAAEANFLIASQAMCRERLLGMWPNGKPRLIGYASTA